MIFLLRQYFKSKVLRWKLSHIERENLRIRDESRALKERQDRLLERVSALHEEAMALDKQTP